MLSQTRLPAPVTRVRLLVESFSIASAHTADMFGMRADAVALEAVRRRLAARFGLKTLNILGEQPCTAREKRRAAVREAQRPQA